MGARLRVCDDGCGRLHVRWWADDGGLWRAILDDFKATFRPYGERSFSPRTKTWSVPSWRRRRLEDWADYWFDGGTQEWDEEEPDGRAYGRRPYRDDRDGATRAGTSAVAAAFAQLHLLPSAPAELVQAAHRTLIKLHHPDHGGDHASAVALNAAIAVILQYQKESP